MPTKNHHQILHKLEDDFTYRPDRGDTWEILIGQGAVSGDCEDFALGLAWRLAGRSWIIFLWHLVTFKSVIWLARTPSGEGHAMLWHRGAGWAENIYATWMKERPFRKRRPILWPFLILFRLLPAYLSKLIKGGR